MRLLICAILLFVTFQSFSQLVVTVTWINSDKPLLRVLQQKFTYNGIILGGQIIIHEALKDIKNSKKRIRQKEYESNKLNKDLKIAVGLHNTTNTVLLGAPKFVNTKFSFYNTPSKRTYFMRELRINSAIGGLILMAMKKKKKKMNIRNANTQELYSLNVKMLTKLKETNKNVHKTAAFVIGASLLTGAAVMSSEKLDKILELGL
jgi:hypothetical protein